MSHQQSEDRLHISGESEAVLDIFIDFCRIDVDMNELAIARIFREIAGLTIAEA